MSNEPGDIIVTRELWERLDDWRVPMNERDAYIWLGLYGPAHMNVRYLAGHWRWEKRRVLPFVRKMIACGLFRLADKKLSAVHLREAERHPEYIAGQRWADIRLRVFVRDGFACTYCGSRERLHCDHVTPRIQGGLDVESNLTTACGTCNCSKGGRTPEEWRGH